MLRMPPFEVHTPRTAAEAVQRKTELPGSLYVAGGTDLLPNLKHWLHTPPHLISLADCTELVGVTPASDGALRIGAGTTLHAVASDPTITASLPGLASAVQQIAGPQHRRMGTLGGNVMLDTRCLFYNQTRDWREALGYCLKKDGSWCHVIGSAKACVAAQSSDSVPMLVALDASIEAALPDGSTATVALSDLYTKDGRFLQNHTLHPDALVTAITVPAPAEGHRSIYRKVRSRAAIDYPQLSIALVGAFDGPTCTALQIVIGAMLPFPKPITGVDLAVGTPLDDATIDAVAERAFKQARPQTQLHSQPDWRRHLARVEVTRGLRALRG